MDNSLPLIWVILAKVITGKAYCANDAVGVVLAIKHITLALIGSIPKAIKIPAGIATAVPNPAIASKNPPKPQAIINTNIRLSVEIELNKSEEP